MYTIAALGIIAFTLGMVFTPVCRDIALRFDIVDRPDGERKFHTKPTPRLGGIAIVFAYSASLLLVLLFTPASQQIHIQHRELLESLLPAAAIIFLTGLLDDIVGLRPWQKLLGEILGASLAIGLGVHYAPHTFPIAPDHPLLAHRWIAVPVSLIWLVACTNAVNLIDGLDGLASGVGLFATISTLLVGVFTGHEGLVLATMPLAGALLAFLYYNFNPASIFLGDSGSLTIGFMLGAFGLIWSESSSSIIGIAAPLMVLAVPLIDVGLSVCRRYLRRVPIFKADRGHIHHRMMAHGFKPRQAALILYCVCAIAASLALLQTLNLRYVRYVVIAVFLLLVWAGIRYLDYIELGAARRALSRKHIQSMVQEDIYLHELDTLLGEAQTPEDCWIRARALCVDLRFASAEMYFQETYFEEIFDAEAPDRDWQLTLPLGERGYLRLSRAGSDKPPAIMMPALDHLQETFAKKELVLPMGLVKFSDAA